MLIYFPILFENDVIERKKRCCCGNVDVTSYYNLKYNGNIGFWESYTIDCKHFILFEVYVLPLSIMSQNTSIVRQSFLKYPSTALKLGIAQAVFGLLAVMLGVVALVTDASLSYLGTGIWTGTIFFVSGFVGIFSSRHSHSPCPLISFLVLSIVSSVASLVLSWIAVTAAVDERLEFRYGFFNHDQDIGRAALASNVILLVISLIEIVSAILSAAICCKELCICSTQKLPSPTAVYYFPGQYAPSSAGHNPYPPLTTYNMSYMPPEFTIMPPKENTGVVP